MRKRFLYRLWALPRGLREIDSLLLLLGTLRRIGWSRSVKDGLPEDDAGLPLPWLTYPFIYWLDGALSTSDRVLEIGAGNSTLWLASRVEAVVSVEHDSRWADRVSALAPQNVEVIPASCLGDEFEALEDDPYIAAVRGLPQDSFDVVFIDGMARVAAARASVRTLKAGGMIVVDNTDRPLMRGGIEYLESCGFGRIDFVGLPPGATNFSCTSVLARDFCRWVTRPNPPKWWGATITDFFGPHTAAPVLRGPWK